MSPSSGFGSHTLSCLPYPNGYTSQPYPVWEETATEHEYRKAKIMGAKWMAEKEVVWEAPQTHFPAKLPELGEITNTNI